MTWGAHRTNKRGRPGSKPRWAIGRRGGGRDVSERGLVKWMLLIMILEDHLHDEKVAVYNRLMMM
jgi:hypothetical protein